MIREAKVVVIGGIGVGKSSLTIRFVNNQFYDFLDSTLGAVFFEKVYSYGQGKSVKFQFWDTAGQEKYKAIARIYYKDAKVAVVMYDVNSRDSFNTMKTWVEELKQNAQKNLILAIVGNKIDLIKDQEEVPYKEAVEYAKELGAIFKYTSAKENKGINELFTTIAEKLESAKQDEPSGTTSSGKANPGQSLNNKKRQKNDNNGGCC